MRIGTVVDVGERAAILLLSFSFLYNIVPTISAHPYNLLLFLVEMATVVLILIRRTGPMALGAWQIFIGFLGTALPLMVRPVSHEIVPVAIGTALMTAGLLLSFAAKLFLNRSFGIIAANRGVKRGGPYRLVRHPMYSGYMLTQLGFLGLNFSGFNLALYATAWVAQILRLREEEKFLLQDAAYRDFAGTVRHRLLPGVY